MSPRKQSQEKALELVKEASLRRAIAKQRWDEAEVDADRAHQEYRKADGDLRRARIALNRSLTP